MTEQQIFKTVWLNRAYFIKLKLSALYSLKENDKKRAKSFIEMLPCKSDPEIAERCKAILEQSAIKSEEKYLHILNLYNETREETESAIEKIDDEEYQALLIAHYLDHKSWNQIARENFYGLRTVKYKHLKALDMLEITSASDSYTMKKQEKKL